MKFDVEGFMRALQGEQNEETSETKTEVKEEKKVLKTEIKSSTKKSRTEVPSTIHSLGPKLSTGFPGETPTEAFKSILAAVRDKFSQDNPEAEQSYTVLFAALMSIVTANENFVSEIQKIGKKDNIRDIDMVLQLLMATGTLAVSSFQNREDADALMDVKTVIRIIEDVCY